MLLRRGVLLVLVLVLGGCSGGSDGSDAGGSTGSSGCTSSCPTVETLAGSGRAGLDDGLGTKATFKSPEGVDVDAQGNVYVADYGNNVVRKIDTGRNVTTLGAGKPMNHPVGVAVDADGNVFVAATDSHQIDKIDAAGIFSVIAGNGAAASNDGPGPSASFAGPSDVCLGGQGKLYVADYAADSIRLIAANGDVSTFVAASSSGDHVLRGPHAVAVDSTGALYVAAEFSDSIRKIAPDGTVSTFARSGSPGFTDGPAGSAQFRLPVGIAIDAQDNVYVADSGNHAIRKITPSGQVTTLAGTGSPGFASGTGGRDGNASFNTPSAVAVDAQGNVFVADYGNNAIRVIHP